MSFNVRRHVLLQFFTTVEPRNYPDLCQIWSNGSGCHEMEPLGAVSDSILKSNP